ncbi:MAG: DUF1802 family protein [Phycisphaerales bacterium]|nr:DUF1802 family protein [Phycisphaerales bacterium]
MTEPSFPTAPLTHALKEWDVVCRALQDGSQAILLRKGGIYESAGVFELEHSRFALYPTFIHQHLPSIKPAHRATVAAQQQEPVEVTITAWAECQQIVPVPGRAQLEQLNDLHLWDKPLLDMRFSYRPDYPLYLVLLRAWRLPQPVQIAAHPDYAGCKSWIPLKQSIATQGSEPALPSHELNRIAERINLAFAAGRPLKAQP